MSESWKGPSAVIGITGILVTLGIFVYQAKEAKVDKAQKDPIENIVPLDGQKERDSIARAALHRHQIEQRVLWIDRHLPKFNDSIPIVLKQLRKDEIRFNYARKRLADTITPLSETSKEGLYELQRYYTISLRDSVRLHKLVQQHDRLSERSLF